jgi:hypothetical protein
MPQRGEPQGFIKAGSMRQEPESAKMLRRFIKKARITHPTPLCFQEKPWSRSGHQCLSSGSFSTAWFDVPAGPAASSAGKHSFPASGF